ncbi:hypothetical protein Lal_00008366 [Lupinus albus]|nr:hypothetical protein Lal_00008366 [Lupinus albus]
MSFPWANHYKPGHPFMQWLDEKLPLPRFVYNAVGAGYPVPRNLNYFWNFGILAGVCLMLQIVTGVILAMHYAANTGVAFDSTEHIMRDVNWGWMLRYAHANGASAFFVVVYVHIFRGPARDDLAAGRGDLPAHDGHRLHGLCASLGPDELLGRQGHHRPVRRDPAGGRTAAAVAARRLLARSGRAQPLLLAALPAALRDPGRGDPARLGAAHPERERHRSLPPVLHGEGRLWPGRVPAALLRGAVLRAERAGPPGQLHSGQPDEHPGAHRARMVLLAVLRDPARLHVGLLLHPGQADGRARHVQRDPGVVLPALAGYLAGPFGPVSSAVPQVLLRPARGRADPGILRRRAGRGTLRDDLADRRDVLLPALPRHSPARFVDREARTASLFDHRSRAGQG